MPDIQLLPPETPQKRPPITSVTSPAPDESLDIQDTEISQLIRDGTSMGSPPSSVTSDHTRRFDERLQSRLSKFITSNLPSSPQTELLTRDDSVYSTLYNEEPETMVWSKMRKISDRIYNRNFRIDYGEPVVMTASSKMIIIGTARGYVLIYDPQQKLLHELGHRSDAIEHGSISTMCLSLDSTTLAVGYKSGHIFVWSLDSLRPTILFQIDPVSAEEVQRNASGRAENHMVDSFITEIRFVGAKHTSLISTDQGGLMVFQQGTRTVMGYRTRSKIMMGKYQISSDTSYLHAILGFSMLPVGSSPQLTDKMGVISIITPEALVVVSTAPKLQTHFKVGKPKAIEQGTDLTGSVAWFPATFSKTEKTTAPALLAYCWSNVVTLFEVTSETIKDHSGRESTMLRFENKKRWICTEPVVNMQWLNTRVVTVLTKSQRLIFLGRDDLKTLSTVDMISKHIKPESIYENNQLGLIEQNFANSIKALKSNIFVLGKSNFYVGTLNSWADILFAYLKDGHYIRALEEACRQYAGDCDITLLGLPLDDDTRHKIVRDHIVQILDASLNFLFSADESVPDSEKRDLLLRFATAAFKSCATIDSDAETYERLYEVYYDHRYEDIFFEALETPLLKGEIKTLPPEVLRKLVQYYVDHGNGQVLEETLCELDITQLDLDFTIRLCKENHLDDTLVYIWNVLLQDYITPILDGVKAIKALEDPSQRTDQELQHLNNTVDSLYTYITYILTGRQYPTDRPIDPDNMDTAKLNVYYVLFNGAAIGYPEGQPKFHVTDNIDDEPVFPYLYVLLKHDSFRMLSALNEAFEDELLNDDEVTSFSPSGKPNELKVNRQYIIDVLLGIFRQESDEFTQKDHTHLAIFIARNYPKYSQFIRLSDTVLSEMVSDLCAYPDMKNECELSLQSLLSVYKPTDYDELIATFESCGFYDALLNLYRKENKHLQILELWVDAQKTTSAAGDEPVEAGDKVEELSDDNTEPVSSAIGQFKSVPDMVRESLVKTQEEPIHHRAIMDLLHDNFVLFVKVDPENMAEVIGLNGAEELNMLIFKLDSENYKYRYLTRLVQLQAAGKLPFSLTESTQIEYAVLLSKYDHEELGRFVLHVGNVHQGWMDFLDSHQEFQIMIDLYQSRGDYTSAIRTTVSSLNDLGHQLMSAKSLFLPGIGGKMIGLLALGFQVIRKVADNIPMLNGMSLRENLQLQLVETAVNLFVAANQKLLDKRTDQMTDTEKERTITLFKRLTQDAFQDVLGDQQDSSDSFLRIFYEFLSRSSVKVTTLGDVRPVLTEVFLSYSHDEVILNLILKLLNDDIYKDLVDLEALQLQGWSPMHLECEVCGQKVWGSQISQASYETWQDHKLGTKEEKDKLKDLQVYAFSCRHCYHTACLEKMGLGKDKYCILCREEEEKREAERVAKEQRALAEEVAEEEAMDAEDSLATRIHDRVKEGRERVLRKVTKAI